MNKAHIIARIAFAIVIFYYLLSMVPLICGQILFLVENFENAVHSIEIFVYVAGSMTLIVLAVFLLILFLKKVDRLAQYATGPEEAAETAQNINWVSLLFRLICCITGFIFLFKFILGMAEGYRLFHLLVQVNQERALPRELLQIASWILLLPVTIYLLCGAPHFVRWHVKKTLELASEQPTSNLISSNTESEGENNGIV
ncbi:MAG: hypothetical protein JXA82_04945 [Sedimentisphaerales bacterium]|nr:hypothetical protein [Sedimentisphaerales bacterium]